MRRILIKICNVFAVASGLLLLYIAGATLIGVFLRQAFNSPSRFLFESAELALAICVFLAIPFTASKMKHVRVQIVPQKYAGFDAQITRIGNVATGLVLIGLGLVIGQQSLADFQSDTRIGYGGGLPRWIPMLTMMLGLTVYGLLSIVSGKEIEPDETRTSSKGAR